MKKKLTMTTTSRNKPFEEGYQDFIRVRTILRVSDATIKHYNGTYKRFVRFFGKDTLCNEINKNTPLDFVEWLQEENPEIKIKSINTYLIDLGAIFNYLAEYSAQVEHPVLWSSFFVTLVAKKYRLATMLPFVPRMVCDSR